MRPAASSAPAWTGSAASVWSRVARAARSWPRRTWSTEASKSCWALAVILAILARRTARLATTARADGHGMRRIAVINQKGGVGKTTTAVNLGAGLARIGCKVLVCDLDPQCNLTVHLDVDPAGGQPSAYELLHGKSTLEGVVRSTKTGGLEMLPASID